MPLGITLGCPAGVGPEIILRFWLARNRGGKPVNAVVIGDRAVLEYCARQLGLDVGTKDWQPGKTPADDAINVLNCSFIDMSSFAWGRPDVRTGRAMADYIRETVRLIGEGRLSGMVTCPIAKIGLLQAGYEYPGHTEMLADLCNAKKYAMMMASDELKVCLATIHVALKEVPSLLRTDEIVGLIELTVFSLRRDFAMEKPRIGVAGLNPHAGEEGMFGGEEEKIIGPAVEIARRKGYLVQGPLPPDTIFYRAVHRNDFDAVICMYHDQGLIPFKLLHFRDGVNVTIGLPIVRTSVDHGTAYDIAGRGIADYSSLAAAFRMAEGIVENRAKAAADL
jgi:4-hydroxythreonine-4-phosphate dehydrogenase